MEPKYNFDTGIAQTIEWYLNNKEWWQNILSGEYANYFDKMYGKPLIGVCMSTETDKTSVILGG